MTRRGIREAAISKSIGIRIRHEREQRGLLLYDCARALGVTLQQMGKYEMGINRISAPTLLQLASFMKTQPEMFFPKLPRYRQGISTSN